LEYDTDLHTHQFTSDLSLILRAMPRRYHALKKPKVRQDWSKETLYNLTRLTTPPAANRTFFQHYVSP